MSRDLPLGDDRIDQRPNSLKLDANNIAGLELQPLRVADARGRARRDDIARFQREDARSVLDDVGDLEDHLARVSVLPQLVVDPELDPEPVDVFEVRQRNRARPHRREIVAPLAVEPVEELVPIAVLGPVPDLQLALGDVVDDGDPGDVVERVFLGDELAGFSDDEPKLGLVVDELSALGDDDRVAIAADRVAGGLHEDAGRGHVALGDARALELLAGALENVVGIIPGEAEQFARIQDRGFELDARQIEDRVFGRVAGLAALDHLPSLGESRIAGENRCDAVKGVAALIIAGAEGLDVEDLVADNDAGAGYALAGITFARGLGKREVHEFQGHSGSLVSQGIDG